MKVGHRFCSEIRHASRKLWITGAIFAFVCKCQTEIKVSSKNFLKFTSESNSLLNYKLWESECVTRKSSTLLFPPINKGTFKLILQSRQPSALTEVPQSTQWFCGLWVLSSSRKFTKSKLQKQKITRKNHLPIDLMSSKSGHRIPVMVDLLWNSVS